MNRVKFYLLFLFLIFGFSTSNSQNLGSKWIHGSGNCSTNADPPFEVRAYDKNTFILRQNKCINYEAPFLYLFLGEEKALLQDTGAAPAEGSNMAFPVRETVQQILHKWSEENGKPPLPLLVTHSHAHGDHVGGDSQFRGQPNTTLVGTTPEDVQAFFGIPDWPNQIVTLDLGRRVLDIIPIPGHEASSIAIYDRQTKLLLTGDTVYPGRLYIRDWPAFQASIARLASFVKSHEISSVLGTHIEMTSNPGVDYPVRTIYQPQERELGLKASHVLELHEALTKMKDGPVRQVHNDFIIYPR